MKQLITREVRLKQCFRFGLLSATITILPTLVESYMFNTSVSSLLTLYIKNCFTIFSLLILVLGYRKIQFKHRAKITIIFPSLVGKLNLTLIIITIIGILVTIVIDAISLDQSRKNVFVSNVTIVLTHNYLDSTQKNSNKTVFLQRNKKNIDAYYMGRKLLINDNDEQTIRKILLKEKFESQIYNKKRSCFIKNTLFQSNYKNVKQAYWRPMRYTAPFNEEFIFRFFFYSLSTGVALYIIKTEVAMKKQKCRFIIFKCFIALALSVIFAVLHKPDHNGIGLLSVTTMSLFAFYLVDRSRGMLLPILLHFISNWLGFIGAVSLLSVLIHSNT